MLDDIRNHDARPTAEENEWLRTDPVLVVVKALALAAIAITVGVSVSQFFVPGIAAATPQVATLH